MPDDLAKDFISLMAKAGVSIEDALWFHCDARIRGITSTEGAVRFMRINALLAVSTITSP